MKFSLVIATLGRKKELFEMLDSVKESNYDLNLIEVIIVDQNDKGFINDKLINYQGLNLKYIHSLKKGLSYNRNIGLKNITGDIVCFPDDDCKFYNDTFSQVSNVLVSDNYSFCIGRIYDRDKKINLFKKWPNKKTKINKFNSYFLNSSITLFLKKEQVLSFDERLGVGAEFGSCEDADYIYRMLINKVKGIYLPCIQVWHPEPNYNQISLDKVTSYASGFKYFVGKNTDVVKSILFLLLIIKKSYQFLFKNKEFKSGYFKAFFVGLFRNI